MSSRRDKSKTDKRATEEPNSDDRVEEHESKGIKKIKISNVSGQTPKEISNSDSVVGVNKLVRSLSLHQIENDSDSKPTHNEKESVVEVNNWNKLI